MIYWSNCQFFVNAAAGFVCERDEPEEFIKIDWVKSKNGAKLQRGELKKVLRIRKIINHRE